MKSINFLVHILLALLFIATVPYAAEAGNVKIYPNQFKPVDPSDPYNLQSPSYLYGNGGDAYYYAVVKLPVGKTVTRVVAYHQSNYSSPTASSVSLRRCQFGVSDEPEQVMTNLLFTGNTGGATVAMYITDIDYPKVKSQFRYWVLVTAANGNTVHGVKVVYE